MMTPMVHTSSAAGHVGDGVDALLPPWIVLQQPAARAAEPAEVLARARLLDARGDAPDHPSGQDRDEEGHDQDHDRLARWRDQRVQDLGDAAAAPLLHHPLADDAAVVTGAGRQQLDRHDTSSSRATEG
jgi:hypothetical protein